MTTRVHITVDTEFNIAGAFRDPVNRRPVGSRSVYCPIDGRSEGLGFLLAALSDHGIKATFFLEALNTCYFGDEPMAAIAAEITAAGHDAQLHLHPCWTYFEHPEWMKRLASDPPNDDVTLRSVDELVRLIGIGRAAFRRWGLPEPRVLRTGGLRVAMNVYRAMARCGLPLSSNIGLAVYRPAESELQLYAGCHDVGGVMELPVTTYTDLRLPGRVHHKTLTITGTSWPEMRSLLLQARAAGLSDVVVLTHPFEFIKHQDATYETLYVDRVNRRRLERLCAFITSEAGLEPATLGDRVDRCCPGANPLFRVSPFHAAGRVMVNRINHTIMRF